MDLLAYSECVCRLPDTALGEYNYYMDTGRLRIETSNMMNNNTVEDLRAIRDKVRSPAKRFHVPAKHVMHCEWKSSHNTLRMETVKLWA